MGSLFLILIPILLTDIVNPVLLAAVVFALGSKRPLLNANAVLFGWLTLYFIAGIILALGLESISEFLANPRPIDFYIETVVGMLLVWLALRCFKKEDPRKKEKELGDADNLKTSSAFWIGASINLFGLPFAIPYFAAIDQILKTDMEWFPAVIALLIYNLLYILPFGLLIVVRYFYKEKSDQLFALINEKMEKVGNIILPLLLFLIGGALLADAIKYFITGEPLF
jgi:small neutral amino acid transporter SnatA (MarC family)